MDEAAESETETTGQQLLYARCSSDSKNNCSFSFIQRDVADVITSVQKFTDLPDFRKQIGGEALMKKLKDISKQLHYRKDDLLKTECTIIVAGESSPGKASVINLIIGEDILPTDITATTSRICRLRYSEKLQISTCDIEDRQIHVTEFNDKEILTEELSKLAMADDDKLKYIDVRLPVEILKGNIVIVDAPVTEDEEHEEAATILMEYIPNALAFVYVGGLESDQVGQMLESVRGFLNQLHSFDPNDAIFLLNKWDTLTLKNRNVDLFEQTKEKLHNIWQSVDDNHILKFASDTVEENDVCRREFTQIQQILKSIIEKNENKQIKAHIEFLLSIIEEYDAVLTNKVKCAKQTREDKSKILDKVKKESGETEQKRQEAFRHLQITIDRFLKEKAEMLHEVIHSQNFKERITKDIGKFARFRIGSEMDSRIKKETYYWQIENIEKKFKSEVMDRITETFTNACQAQHMIKCKMEGFAYPSDVQNRIGAALTSVVAYSGTALVGHILMTQLSANRNTATVVAAAGFLGGIVGTGLQAFDLLDDTDTIIHNAYKARVDKMTTDQLEQFLTKAYAQCLRNIVHDFLEGDVEKIIHNLRETTAFYENKVAYHKREESNLVSLSSDISEIRNRLNELENTEVVME